MTRRFAPLALLLALAALPACDSTADLVIGGTYSGVTEQAGTTTTTVTLTIPETESGGTFTFSALVTEGGPGGSDEAQLTGTGVYDHPEITLTIDGDTVEGTVVEGGAAIRLEVEPGEFVTFTRA